MIVAVCGRPGSGKSTLVRHLISHATAKGITSAALDDYPRLYGMFRADVMQRRFVGHDHGFTAIDLRVLDDVLVDLEREALDLERRTAVVFIEFSRDNYLKALSNLRPSLLENLELIFIEANLESCVARVMQRIGDPLNPGNSSFDEDTFRRYYGGAAANPCLWERTVGAAVLNKELGIREDHVRYLASDCARDSFLLAATSVADELYRDLTFGWEESWTMITRQLGQTFPQFGQLPLDHQPGFVADVIALAHVAATHTDLPWPLGTLLTDRYSYDPQSPPPVMNPSAVASPDRDPRAGLWSLAWTAATRSHPWLGSVPSAERSRWLTDIVERTCDYMDGGPRDDVVVAVARAQQRARVNAHDTSL